MRWLAGAGPCHHLGLMECGQAEARKDPRAGTESVTFVSQRNRDTLNASTAAQGEMSARVAGVGYPERGQAR